MSCTVPDKELFPCSYYPDYQQKRIDTTFYKQFLNVIKDKGLDEVKPLYEKFFNMYKTDVKHMVELTSVLNHILWLYFDRYGTCPESKLFNKLYIECNTYCCKHFQDDDLNFYLTVLD